MNIHKNARLSLVRRIELVKMIIEQGLTEVAVAREAGVSPPTARKWLGRYLAEGEAGLVDRSSRPKHSPRAISSQTALAIVEFRRRRLTQARIAASVGVSQSTVGRVLRRAGLSRWRDLEPSEPVVRYEHEHPGDLLHIDTKKLARIEAPGHRVTGDRHGMSRGAGWEFLFVAVDDHSRIAFTDLHRDERSTSAVQFLQNAIAYYRSLGVIIRRIITDNGPAFRSKLFREACIALAVRHSFTGAYRPQTNGKAERFIQSALREWAYGIAYNHSSERLNMLDRWNHYYNWHRPHHGIERVAPISRLARSRNNLLTLHS